MDGLQIGQHISGQYNEDLENLLNHVMKMGGLIEQQLSDALTAVNDSDEDLAQKVIANDHKVNKLEVNIDQECTMIIAKRQPAAGDLRLIMAIIKTIADLERIGDEAEKLAKVAQQNFSGKQDFIQNLDHLGRHVLAMLKEALDAFARMDFDAAIAVHGKDNKIDRAYEALMRQLMTYMMEDPRSIPQVMTVIWSARALERIGDRCKNICEYVIYYVKGEDVRHVADDELQKLN